MKHYYPPILLLTLVLQIGAAAAHAQSGKTLVETRYDRFDKKTVVSTAQLPAVAQTPARIEVGAMVSFAGESLRYPLTSAYLFIVATSRSLSFAKDHELVALVDGERIGFGNLKYDYDVKPPLSNERMGTTVSRDTLVKIAGAKSAEMRLGAVEFKLTDTHRAAFGELAERMGAVPGGSKPLLEITALKIDRVTPSIGYVTGEVKNISDVDFDNLSATVKCVSADGSALWEGSLGVVYGALAPGESSPLRAGPVSDPRITKCEARFEAADGIVPHAGPGR